MVSDRQVKLHPWTGAMYLLENEEYAMMSGQEIKFYIEVLNVLERSK